MTARQLSRFYPNLTPLNYCVTSDETKDYNCGAWATGRQDENVDFSQDEEGNPIYNLSVAPYIAHYESLGFQKCESRDLEDGIEKIAIFEQYGEFSHVCAQLENGSWASKLGEWEDIIHLTLEALEGKGQYCYGEVKTIMKRPRQTVFKFTYPSNF